MEKLYGVSFGSKYSEVTHVLAESWTEAITKAEAFWEHKQATQSILDEDNSLRVKEKLKVKNIELITDEIVR